jgi:unsaturated rhamnogalacturonyl hydrolase
VDAFCPQADRWAGRPVMAGDRGGAGLDRSQAALAEPPRPPAPLSFLTPAVLEATGRRVAERATTMGLSQWFWGEGVVLQGMLRFAAALAEPIPAFVRDFVDRHLHQGIELGHVNNLAPGAACAALLEATGGDSYATGCRQLLDWLETSDQVTRAANGAIEHWPGGVWADTVFMAGSFLLPYARLTGRADLITEAGRQLLAHAELLQHPESGLYAHGSHENKTIWCFWGRANAWSALATVDFLETVAHFPTLTSLSEQLRPRLEWQLRALADLQPDHGVWDVLVDGQAENRGILETSAAAGIAAAMFRAAALGVAPDRLRAAAWRALAGVHAYVDDGTLTRTSAGTILQLIPFGYSVIRNDRVQPWGQGLALHAYAAALQERAPRTRPPEDLTTLQT